MANININNRKLITFTPQIIEDYARGKCNFAFGGGKVTLKYKITSPTPIDEDFPLYFFSSNGGATLDIQVSGGTINGATSLIKEFKEWEVADLNGKVGDSDLHTILSERVRVKFDSELTLTATVKPKRTVLYAWDEVDQKYVSLSFDCAKCTPGSQDLNKELQIYTNFLGERIEYNAVGCHNRV